MSVNFTKKIIRIGSGVIRCHCCEAKLAKEKHDKARARNAVEQLIHTQIQRGYNLNIPVNRSFTNLRFAIRVDLHDYSNFLFLLVNETVQRLNTNSVSFISMLYPPIHP